MKIEVFLKAGDFSELYIKNISTWIQDIPEDKYEIILVCPEEHKENYYKKFNKKTISDFYNFSNPIYNQIINNLDGSRSAQKAARANFTCIDASVGDFFWNIDADSTLHHKNKKISHLMNQVENIFIDQDLYILSLDYWRTTGFFPDHWSYGICVQKKDFSYIENNVKNFSDINYHSPWSPGLRCNMDWVLDQIRRSSISDGKIKTFASPGLTLNHRGDINIFNDFIKSHSVSHFKITPYPSVSDYIVIK